MIELRPYLSEFLTIAFVHLLAVASPGPDFAIVLKSSVSHGRRAALLTSLGIGSGIFIHVGYCVLGLGLLISQSPALFGLIKYLGAAYLIFIGVKALAAKSSSAAESSSAKSLLTARQAFVQGLATNALNPKATLFFLAVFSAVVSPATPSSVKALYGLWMACATAAWFSMLSWLFSSDLLRKQILGLGIWFDRLMGSVLVLLGLRLAAMGALR